MIVRVALQVFDGPETDDLPHDTGEKMREVQTQRVLDFEVVTSGRKRITAGSAYWGKWREAILDAVEKRAMTGRIENYILPLDTEVFLWHPRRAELKLGYLITCSKCAEGVSELTDKGLCCDCSK